MRPAGDDAWLGGPAPENPALDLTEDSLAVPGGPAAAPALPGGATEQGTITTGQCFNNDMEYKLQSAGLTAGCCGAARLWNQLQGM